MPELRLPALTDASNSRSILAWASELANQLRRQWVFLLKRVQPISPYGLQAEDGSGNLFTIPLFKPDVTILDVSSTTTAVALVRPGLCFGVFAQNLEAVTGSLSSYQIGTTTPADADAWHATHPLTAQTLENADQWLNVPDFTITPPIKYDAATDIVLTPNGGTFTDGLVKLYSFTLDFKVAL